LKYKAIIFSYCGFLIFMGAFIVKSTYHPYISNNIISWKPKALEDVRGRYNSGHGGGFYGGHK
jgi:hypothetical protein